MLTTIQKNLILIDNFLGGNSQKWVWSFWLRDSKTECISENKQLE